ncbi:uncharacterized protein LY89DRAFT_281747 [Mollisia scopiformis]|uniref:Uncharacterized protein n=1 Tax=Mollisia scopiformis TaxID=149040 RepID=A0A132BAG3_MOLSC|nr:uncharacterized protein LY89DRAFT_281747 [Mollisia scopiformis]KUJ09253.1 hypothetical protein LY89DRAFT_281747 [Mollisia scopiformis]
MNQNLSAMAIERRQLPQVLNQAIANIPVPLTHNAAARDALLPWLALGYTPVPTPSGDGYQENMCGYYALAGSLRAAWQLWGLNGRSPTVAELQATQASQLYRDLVRANMDDLGLVEAAADEYWNALTRANMLDAQGMRLVLEAIVEERGLELDLGLGIVTEGFRVRWVEESEFDTAGFDESSVNRTSVQYDEPVNSRRGVIWVYNNGGKPDVKRVRCTPQFFLLHREGRFFQL